MKTRTAVSLLLALVPAATTLAQDADLTAAPAIKVAATDPAPAATSDAVALQIPKVVLYANCDKSTAFPFVTPNDIACFFNHVAAGTSYANCDGSTVKPLITPNDYVCFLNAYSQAIAWQNSVSSVIQ